jgi:hypothetical protein
MRPSLKGRLVSRISLVVIVCSAGCAGRFDATPDAAESPRPAAASAGVGVVHIVGLLTLKGAELGAWWAVTDDSGVVWRFEPTSADQSSQLRQWQNRRIAVDGVRTGAVLSTPLVRIERALLIR